MGTRRRLCVLDVGQGSSAVVDCGDGGVVVVDTACGSALCEFLREQKIERIRTVYLSHADEDHIGGLVGLLAANVVQVERIVVNSDATKATKVWDDVVYELDRAHGEGRVEFKVGLIAGDGDDLGDVEIRVLGPSRYLVAKGVGGTDRSGNKISSNSMSAVVRVSVSGRHVAVFPGDVDGVGLDDLVARVTDVAAPVLVYPHHGGRPGRAAVRPFVERLLKALSPRVVVFSFARERYGFPNEEVIRVVRELRPDARIVCTQLARRCSVTVPSQPRKHLSDVFARGRAEGHCCGGTIVIPAGRHERSGTETRGTCRVHTGPGRDADVPAGGVTRHALALHRGRPRPEDDGRLPGAGARLGIGLRAQPRGLRGRTACWAARRSARWCWRARCARGWRR